MVEWRGSEKQGNEKLEQIDLQPDKLAGAQSALVSALALLLAAVSSDIGLGLCPRIGCSAGRFIRSGVDFFL